MKNIIEQKTGDYLHMSCYTKFKLNKINKGYELIYKDSETGVEAELTLQPEQTEDFNRKLQLVKKLVSVKNSFGIQLT